MHFKDEYEFLSNFAPAPVKLYGRVYPTVEHAFQAAKTKNPAERLKIVQCSTPGQAKRAGRKLTLRSDWEQIKEWIMAELLKQKFATEPFRSKLQAITEPIVESNNWHDNYWGICECNGCQNKGLGQNRLGALLEELKNNL